MTRLFPCYRTLSFAMTALAGTVLCFSACDHAKDLVEQGKKQAADIQKSIEAKTGETTSNTTPEAGSSTPAVNTPPTAPTSPPAIANGSGTPAAAPPAAPTRDFAQLVEGFMKVAPAEKTDSMLQELAAIPEEFRGRLTECNLSGSKVTDAGVLELAKFPNLILINLISCPGVGDSGLAGIKDLTNLESLRFDSTKVSDSGMIHLRNLTRLKVLGLGQTAVTDGGLAKLQELPQLEEFYLSGTAITGSGLRKVNMGNSLHILKADASSFGVAGMGSLGAHKNLEEVDLTTAKVSDKTVGSLKGLSKLRSLKLNHNPVTDKGVKQLTGLLSLEEISLGGTQISDNCLTVFKPCKNLRYFDVRITGVTTAGHAFIRKIAPQCTIDYQ
jgi:Leucine-rich repeat (LRR) protein